MTTYRIEHYLGAGELKDLYIDWLKWLRDSQAKVAVVRHVTRIELGNFGDHKFCRDGVWELCIDVGPGYRVYYALSGNPRGVAAVLRDKRNADIARAVGYWQDWQRRADDEE